MYVYCILKFNGMDCELWVYQLNYSLDSNVCHCNCVLGYWATQMALCSFWILLRYFLFALNCCKQGASLLTSKTILTWDQLPGTLEKVTNGFLLFGKMFLMHHANIFTDEIFSSMVPYLFFFIKLSQVKRVQDWLWNIPSSVTDQIR